MENFVDSLLAQNQSTTLHLIAVAQKALVSGVRQRFSPSARLQQDPSDCAAHRSHGQGVELVPPLEFFQLLGFFLNWLSRLKTSSTTFHMNLLSVRLRFAELGLTLRGCHLLSTEPLCNTVHGHLFVQLSDETAGELRVANTAHPR